MADDKDSELKLFFPYIEKYDDNYKLSCFLTDKDDNINIHYYYKFTINNYNLFIIKSSVLLDESNIINMYIPVKLHTTVLYFPKNIFNTDFDNKEIYLERILPNYSQFTVHTFDETENEETDTVRPTSILSQPSSSSSKIQPSTIAPPQPQPSTIAPPQPSTIAPPQPSTIAPPQPSTIAPPQPSSSSSKIQETASNAPSASPISSTQPKKIEAINTTYNDNNESLTDEQTTQYIKYFVGTEGKNTLEEDIKNKYTIDAISNNYINYLNSIRIDDNTYIIRIFKVIFFYYYSKEIINNDTDEILFYNSCLDTFKSTITNNFVKNILFRNDIIIKNNTNSNEILSRTYPKKLYTDNQMNINITLFNKILNICYFVYNKMQNNTYIKKNDAYTNLMKNILDMNVNITLPKLPVVNDSILPDNIIITVDGNILLTLKYIFQYYYTAEFDTVINNMFDKVDFNTINTTWYNTHINFIKRFYMCVDYNIISLHNYFADLFNTQILIEIQPVPSTTFENLIVTDDYNNIIKLIINEVSVFIDKIKFDNKINNCIIDINSKKNNDTVIENLLTIISLYNKNKTDENYDDTLVFDLETKCINFIVQFSTETNVESINNKRIIIFGDGTNKAIYKLQLINMIYILYDLQSIFIAGDNCVYLNYDIFYYKYDTFKNIIEKNMNLENLSDEYKKKYYEITDPINTIISNMDNIVIEKITKDNGHCESKYDNGILITYINYLILGTNIFKTIKKIETGDIKKNINSVIHISKIIINDIDEYKKFESIYLNIFYIVDSKLTIINPASEINKILNKCISTEGGSIHSLVKNMLGGSLSDEKIIRKLNNETIRNKIKSYYELNSKKIFSKDKDYYNKLHELYLSL